jgi:membrane protein YqaA with SNARE-associated domain
VFLETSILFPFVPSEIVVLFAAALLVRRPVTFLAFMVVAAAGATVGSLFAYSHPVLRPTTAPHVLSQPHRGAEGVAG